MTNAQLYTIIALGIYAIAMALIGCISYGKSKTLDGFLIGGRNIGAWVTAFAYGTTYFSAVVFVGYAGQHGWNIGIGAVWIGIGHLRLRCFGGEIPIVIFVEKRVGELRVCHTPVCVPSLAFPLPRFPATSRP